MTHYSEQLADIETADRSPIPASCLWLPFATRTLITSALVVILTLVAVGANVVNSARKGTSPLSPVAHVLNFGPYATIMNRHYGRNVAIVRHACGFTVTLRQVYADSNQVVVGYTVAGPPNRSFIGGLGADPTPATFPRAVVEPGLALPYFKGAVYTDSNIHEDGVMAVFDAAKVQQAPYGLRIHLTIPALTTVERWNGGPPRQASCETARPFRLGEAPPGWDYRKMSWLTVYGPFVFDVSVPFIVGHVVTLYKSTHMDKTTLTLEHIVISATETRLYVRGLPPDLEQQSYASLSINGKKIAGGGEEIAARTSSTGATVFSFNPVHLRVHETGVVIVHAIPSHPVRPSVSENSSWRFTFTVS